jgi:hypothetical protein
MVTGHAAVEGAAEDPADRTALAAVLAAAAGALVYWLVSA